MPDVRLVDLEIFKRFSLALRQEHADAAEVLAVLEDSAEVVRGELAGGRLRAAAKKRPVRKAAAKKAPARATRARKA